MSCIGDVCQVLAGLPLIVSGSVGASFIVLVGVSLRLYEECSHIVLNILLHQQIIFCVIVEKHIVLVVLVHDLINLIILIKVQAGSCLHF